MKPLRIGLTGGIASGKTSAQRYFENLGVKSIDHDLIARQIVEPGQLGLTQLVAQFGDSILTQDKTLDRQKLKALIFKDQSLKVRVEQILHPLVFQESEALMQRYHAEPYVLIVSPLLIESGSAKSMDKLIVVDIPQEEQLRRLLARDGMSEELALAIIGAQATQDERHAAADILLSNAGDLTALEAEVAKAHHIILQYHSSLV